MLHVDKVDSLQSEKVHITADGLEESQCYKIRLVMHHNLGTHAAYCIIKSDHSGNIDLATDKPLRGTYDEVDAMGLFLSLQPTQSFRVGSLIRDDSRNPTYYQLQLFNESEEKLDEVILRKHWTHPLVSRIEIAHDGLFGTLFKPPGAGPFPCVLDIPGAHGGIVERPSAMLASEGFLVFTFAFYAYHKSLPKELSDVDVEFFEKPIKFIENLPYCSGKIGLYGLSLGGTICTHLAIRHPRISAVISMNGSEAYSNFVLVIRENGEPIPSDLLDEGSTVFLNGIVNQVQSYTDHYSRLTPRTRIPWEKASKETAFRIVASLDDWSQASSLSAVNIQRYLLSVGGNVEVDLVPGGHFLCPPYIPHHSFVFNKFMQINWGLGGECVLHSKSQETVWRKNVEFFKRHLGSPPRIPNWQREERIVIPKDVLVASKL